MNSEEFAREPVPVDRTVSGFRITVVVIGIIIALPSFITGADIGFTLGFWKGALAIGLGGLILSAIAMATGHVGAKMRLNTAVLVKLTFGSFGGQIICAVLALTTLGWFGVTAEIFGGSVQQLVASHGYKTIPPVAYTLLGGVLMTVTTIFGFSALQRLSNLTVPLLAILIVITASITLRTGSIDTLTAPGVGNATLGDGVSAIVGGLAVAATIFPDLSRFCRSSRDAMTSAVITYGIAMPAVLMLAMIPSILTRQHDLVVIMATLGLGAPALVLLITKAWATNAGNLYFASLSAANIIPAKSHAWIVAGAGLVGTLFAAAGIGQVFIPFLMALGIGIPPVAGIYVAEFVLVRRSDIEPRDLIVTAKLRFGAFACWMLGIAIALLARSANLTLTGISACDSIVVAAATYFMLRRTQMALGARSGLTPD